VIAFLSTRAVSQSGVHQRLAVQSGNISNRAQLIRRLACILAATAANVDAQLSRAGETGRA